MRIIIFSIFITISLFAENIFENNFLIFKNPSVSAFNNYNELNFIYDKYNKNYEAGFSFSLFSNRLSFAGKYNYDNEKILFSFSDSFALGDYVSLGGGLNYFEGSYSGVFDFSIRNSIFSFNYSHGFNSEDFVIFDKDGFENFFAFSLSLSDKIQPYVFAVHKSGKADDFENWNLGAGVSFLNFWGFSLNYEYLRKIQTKDSFHSLNLNADLSVFNFGISSLNDDLKKIYLSIKSKSKKSALFVSKDYWLKINLTGKLPEISSGGELTGENYTFADLIFILKRALKDEFIKGILFEIDKPSLSVAQSEEIIELFKKYPKKYRVYIKENTLGDYLLAVNSEKTAVHPASVLMINGPNISMMFYKTLLDKLGVKVYFFKRGNYKTAPENYTNDEPSKYSLEEINGIIKGFREYTNKILSSKINDATVVLDNAPYSPQRALRLSLTDEISYQDEFEKEIIDNNDEILTPQTYNALFAENFSFKQKDKLALLVINGIISEKKGVFLGIKENYRKKILNSIERIKLDPSVSGVIVRIESPGGSGFVSDEIYHALKELKKVKPVYASVSSIGASGGYYIAVAADKIFADKMSIVGSIGVFTGKAVIRDLLAKLYIGIFSKSVWKNGNLNSFYDYLTSEQIEKMEEGVEDFYKLFLSRVSENRHISIKKLRDEVAEGRVFLGEEGKDKGIVDEIGGLNTAVEKMIADNSLSENVNIEVFPQKSGLLYELLSDDKKLLFKLNSAIELLKMPNLLIWGYELNF